MDLSVGAFCRYLLTVRGKNTVKAYRHAVNLLVRYAQAKSIDIHTTPGLLYGFQEWLLARGSSASSLQVLMPGAQKYLEWRRANGDNLPVYPKPDKPKLQRRSPIIIRAAAMRQYLALTSGTEEPFRTLALLYPFSGLRADEMCRLELRQVAKDPGDKTGKRLRFERITGKSRATRDVPLIDPGSSILYSYLTGWRRAIPESPWLFPSQSDWQVPYSDRTMRKQMNDVEQALGGPRLSAHVLRHTWATALAEAGIPLHHVAQLAGHESIQTTYAHYIGQTDPTKITLELGKVNLLEEEQTK